MSSRILPRHLILASTLALIVLLIMLSVFYGQYRLLADSIVDAGVLQHDAEWTASFEHLANSDLQNAAAAISILSEDEFEARVTTILQNTVAANSGMTGLRLESFSGQTFQAGHPISLTDAAQAGWSADSLFLNVPVIAGTRDIGLLSAEFPLLELRQESLQFLSAMQDQAAAHRRDSFLWIGAISLAILVVFVIVLRLIAKSQTQRIRELKFQAEKLSQSDFGEPLQGLRGDELGDLADVFNRMRPQLQ